MENEDQEFREWLINHNACSDSLEWLEGRTPRQAWYECEQADWLLWWAMEAGVGHKDLVYVACQCARRALRFVPEGELRPIRAIETAEAWCEGKAAIAEVREAAAECHAALSYVAALPYAATSAYYAPYVAHAAASAAGSARSDEDIAMCAIIREYIDFAEVWNAA